MISQALRLHQMKVIRHSSDYRVGKLTNNSRGSESKLGKLTADLEIKAGYHSILKFIGYIYGNMSNVNFI